MKYTIEVPDNEDEDVIINGKHYNVKDYLKSEHLYAYDCGGDDLEIAYVAIMNLIKSMGYDGYYFLDGLYDVMH